MRTHVQALQLLDVMIEADVRPDGATWQTLISQSKYVGRHDVADLVRSHYCPAWLPVASLTPLAGCSQSCARLHTAG